MPPGRRLARGRTTAESRRPPPPATSPHRIASWFRPSWWRCRSELELRADHDLQRGARLASPGQPIHGPRDEVAQLREAAQAPAGGEVEVQVPLPADVARLDGGDGRPTAPVAHGAPPAKDRLGRPEPGHRRVHLDVGDGLEVQDRPEKRHVGEATIGQEESRPKILAEDVPELPALPAEKQPDEVVDVAGARQLLLGRVARAATEFQPDGEARERADGAGALIAPQHERGGAPGP